MDVKVEVTKISQFAPDMLDAAVHLDDECRTDALREADELLTIIGAESCSKAVVGAQGLVLIFDTDKPALNAWHFRSMISGYKGCVPRAAAAILAMFGFGDIDEIFEKISSGGTYDYFMFKKLS